MLRLAPLRPTRADPPLRSGQPSPLRRARLSPPGLPPRRGPIGQPSPLRRAPFPLYFRPPGAFFSPDMLL